MHVATGVLFLALAGLSASTAGEEPLACNVRALNPAQRDRYQLLTSRLAGAVARTRELPDGYELALDLSRLPADAHGAAFCVVEVAEWVDLESRCCPFLDFGIAVRGKGGDVTLTLTGGPSVKAFLAIEFPLFEKKAHDILAR
ncbi:MAG: hypothetical protein ABI968_15535 [Acidobacteriota bacterium]